MKKRIIPILTATILLSLTLVGCSSKQTNEGLTTLTIGASPSPHAEILAQAKEALKDKGVNLEIIEYTDYVQPNLAVDFGDLDANYFQHQPYLDNFNEERGTKLTSVATIHYEPYGLYAGKTTSIDELQDKATIAVPNDGTNEARALLLLQSLGLITIKEDAGLNATKLDIIDNPKQLEIVEIEAAQLTHSLPDVDMAVINGNYVLLAGLSASEDAIAVEDGESFGATLYGNVVVVKEGNEENEAVKALVEVLQSAEIAKYIDETYKGNVVSLTK